MLTREQVFKKYYDSDIFNMKPNHITVRLTSPKNRVTHPPFARTKEDVFNVAADTHINRHPEKKPLNRTSHSVKRFNVYKKIYGSDIFNRTASTSTERPKIRKINNNNLCSTCMEGVKNNAEYLQDLKRYENEHRAPKKEYRPDKYIKEETPAERYYKQNYEIHGMVVLPETANNIDKYNYDKEEVEIGENNENKDKKEINEKKNKSNRDKYVHNKRYLNKEIRKYNDVGADKKNIGSNNSSRYPPGKELTNKFGKKKFDWMEKNKSDYHYIDPRDFPMNSGQINKQVNLTSHVLKPEDNKKFDENIADINQRIEYQKHKVYNLDVLGNPIKRIKRDFEEDKNLISAVHTKWERTKIDWDAPETELMFKNYDTYNSTAFERKVRQLADTNNFNIINGNKNDVDIENLQKPLNTEKINDEGTQQVNKMLESIPNLDSNEKLKIRMKIGTLGCNEGWDDKARSLSAFYNKHPRGIHREKQEITNKVNDKIKVNLKRSENKVDHCDYEISYGTKGQNNFDKFDDKEIKNLFGMKGINIYDIHKNPFDKGDFNNIQFKVRYDNKNIEDINNKIKIIQDELNKQKYKVKIERTGKTKFGKNDKELINNPGGKISIMVDNASNRNNTKYGLIPQNIKVKKQFSKEFNNVNYKYKKVNP